MGTHLLGVAGAAGGSVQLTNLTAWLKGPVLVAAIIIAAVILAAKAHKGRMAEAFGVVGVILVVLLIVGLSQGTNVSKVGGDLVSLVF